MASERLLETVVEPRSIAEMLLQAHATGRPVALPDATIGLSHGYAVQADVFAARGVGLAGWKIGLTSENARRLHGADEPVAGRIGEPDVVRSGDVVPLATGQSYVEGELVLVMARTLSPEDAPFSRAQVSAAVGAVHAGIEIVTSRVTPDDLPLGLLAADNGMADRLVLGDRLAEGWQARFSDMPVTLHGPGEAIRPGSTTAISGDPLGAVVWLANWLARHRLGLKAGEIVSSGTCTGVTPVGAGDGIVVDVGGLGSAAIVFLRPHETGTTE